MMGPRTAMTKREGSVVTEPYELFEVECPEEYVGRVVDKLSRRREEKENMGSVAFRIPTCAFRCRKNTLLLNTRGTAVMNRQYDGYRPWTGELKAKENGKTTTYGLEGAQNGGKMLMKAGEKVYRHEIVGIHQQAGDLAMNVCTVE